MRYSEAGMPPLASYGMKDRLVAAACHAFLRDGFSLNIKDVAELAGTSRQTIYRHFQTRENLLEAVLQEVVPSESSLALKQAVSGDTKQTLLAFADAYVKDCTGETNIAMYRVIMDPKNRFDPVTSKYLWDNIYDSVLTSLSEFLLERFKEKLKNRTNSDSISERFLGSLIGYRRFRVAFGVKESAKAQRKAIVEAVDALLNELETPRRAATGSPSKHPS